MGTPRNMIHKLSQFTAINVFGRGNGVSAISAVTFGAFGFLTRGFHRTTKYLMSQYLINIFRKL